MKNAFCVLVTVLCLAYGAYTVATANPNRVVAERIKAQQQGPQLNEPKLLDAARPYLAKERDTFVLLLSTACIHCTNSVPAYRQILDSPAVKSGKLQVVMMFPQDDKTVKDYMGQHGLIAPSVSAASFGAIGVSGTPTQVLIRGAKVVKEWTGEFAPVRVQELFKTMRG